MRIYIKVPDSLRQQLIREFKVSRVTVWSALNYLTGGEQPDSIRRYALDHGGAIEEKEFIPNCRTEHTGDEVVQTFAGGVQVRICSADGSVRLLEDGKEVDRYERVTLQAWGNLLWRAQSMSEKRIEEMSR